MTDSRVKPLESVEPMFFPCWCNASDCSVLGTKLQEALSWDHLGLLTAVADGEHNRRLRWVSFSRIDMIFASGKGTESTSARIFCQRRDQIHPRSRLILSKSQRDVSYVANIAGLLFRANRFFSPVYLLLYAARIYPALHCYNRF